MTYIYKEIKLHSQTNAKTQYSLWLLKASFINSRYFHSHLQSSIISQIAPNPKTDSWKNQCKMISSFSILLCLLQTNQPDRISPNALESHGSTKS